MEKHPSIDVPQSENSSSAGSSGTASPRPSFDNCEPSFSKNHTSFIEQNVNESLLIKLVSNELVKPAKDETSHKKLTDSPFFISEKLAAHKLNVPECNRYSDDKLPVHEKYRIESVISGQVNSKSGEDIVADDLNAIVSNEETSLTDSIPGYATPIEQEEANDYLKTTGKCPSPIQQGIIINSNMGSALSEELDEDKLPDALNSAPSPGNSSLSPATKGSPDKASVTGSPYKRSNSDHLYTNQPVNGGIERGRLPSDFNMDDAPYMRGITGGTIGAIEEEVSFPKKEIPKPEDTRYMKSIFDNLDDNGATVTTDENTRTPSNSSVPNSSINSPRSPEGSVRGLVVDVDIGEYEKKSRHVERR